MSRIARLAIEQPLYPWLLAFVCLFGGLYGIDKVGRLEDPPFPIKNAYIITQYPGASALEVEQEVTDVIEAAVLELPQLDTVTSKSLPGRSEVQIELLERYGTDETGQIWDEMRRRVSEAQARLPPGVQAPLVEDDFGDVYGIAYAVMAPGYSPAQIRDISRTLQRELKLVPGVAKVATRGEPVEALFVEIAHERLVRLGIPIDQIFSSIARENAVVAAGSVAYGDRRLRIAPSLAFDSVQAVASLRIGSPGTTEILQLGDVADIERELVEVPPEIIRANGQRAFTIAASIVTGANVVDIGQAVDTQLASTLRTLPLGIEVQPIYQQHRVVEQSVTLFLRNLTLSIATVIAALCLFMGWRAGAVVGSVLLLTVLGTIGLMSVFGIELQRISLGALMIAMGMLVDNAIVVAEGMVTGVRQGQSPAEAAVGAVRRTQYALLGATIIGVLAFAPISLSDDNSGHFLRSLFQVIAISLLLSWLLAISLVPLLGQRILRAQGAAAGTFYDSFVYRRYRALIRFNLRHAWLTAIAVVATTGACVWGFTQVKQGFFPSINSPLFAVDYYLPQGTDIKVTAATVAGAELAALETPGIETVTSFIGAGSIRYAATVRPEQPNPSYAHILVRVADFEQIDAIMADLEARLRAAAPDAELLVRRNQFTPSGPSKIEARFSGPDANVLRGLADQALAVYLNHDLIDRKANWRQRELQIVPRIDATRARQAGVSRGEVYQAIAFATLGVPVGLYREQDKLLPIIARAPLAERGDLEALANRRIWSAAESAYVPLSQIVPAFDLQAADTLIYRRNRARTIGALANPPAGANPTRVFNALRADVEAIDLPVGYHMDWGGEYEASLEARQTLGGAIPGTFGGMFLITILLFGRIRQPLIIWLTVPMIVCGVVISLLLTDLSFTFPAFLGFLSLAGMLIKNSVVLVDEIDQRCRDDGLSDASIATASISRLRPVMLASGTTIAGMAPLLGDAFFREMAVCIMGGLAFSTLLTLIAVPTFYHLIIRDPSQTRTVSTN